MPSSPFVYPSSPQRRRVREGSLSGGEVWTDWSGGSCDSRPQDVAGDLRHAPRWPAQRRPAGRLRAAVGAAQSRALGAHDGQARLRSQTRQWALRSHRTLSTPCQLQNLPPGAGPQTGAAFTASRLPTIVALLHGVASTHRCASKPVR